MFHAKRLQKELSKVSYPFYLSDLVEAREQTDMRDKTNRSTKVFHQVRSFLIHPSTLSAPPDKTNTKQKLGWTGIHLVAANDFQEWQMDIEVLDENPLYHGKTYRLNFKFSSNYPIEAPEVMFIRATDRGI